MVNNNKAVTVPSMDTAASCLSASSNKGRGNGASLITIPPEIREIIYNHLPDMEEFHLKPGYHLKDRDFLCEFRPPALGRVHPILRAEVLNRMYAHLNIELTRTNDTKSFTRWLSKCSPDVMVSIKTMTIRLPWVLEDPLIITMSTGPMIDLRWDLGKVSRVPRIGVPISPQRLEKVRALLLDTKTLALQAMREHMPQHHAYERRVFTKAAFMMIKNIVFDELMCRQMCALHIAVEERGTMSWWDRHLAMEEQREQKRGDSWGPYALWYKVSNQKRKR